MNMEQRSLPGLWFGFFFCFCFFGGDVCFCFDIFGWGDEGCL